MLGDNLGRVQKIGMIGCGVQARWQLRFLTLITPCRDVIITSRSRESCQKFIDSMTNSKYAKDREWNIVFGSSEKIGKSCQLIHTATNAREPVLKSIEVETFCHVTCVGADTPGKQEITTEIVKKADFVVYDHAEQVKTRGELQHSFDQLKNHSELGTFLQNQTNTENFKLTIFDSTGCAAQDVMIAKRMLQILQ